LPQNNSFPGGIKDSLKEGLFLNLRQRLSADITVVYDELLPFRHKADIYHLA
jgi:hypothetical protein